MYDWLPDALRDDGQVVTANRRLSRELAEAYASRQLAAGRDAWRSPAIASWHDWQSQLFESASCVDDQPTRLSAQQSTVLWEHCLRRELDETSPNIASLVRLAREAWGRIHDWDLPLVECHRAAASRDQRVFAAAARGYLGMLRNGNWIDEAQMTSHVRTLLAAGRLSLPPRVTLAGFDTVVPQRQALLDELGSAGCTVAFAPAPSPSAIQEIRRFETVDSELREAGAWARARLLDNPDERVAIVAAKLEQTADRSRRLVLEGLAPGWQYGGTEHSGSLNVSYGRKLADYPAVGVALRLLRWVTEDLRGHDVCLLLRTPMIGSAQTSDRARLELALRQLPDRKWSPARLLKALGPHSRDGDAADWRGRIAMLDAHRNSLPVRSTPSAWAEQIDALLRMVNWPGSTSLDSREFQLINRWRELLNDLARLEVVSPSMTYAQALARLTALANDVVFQPETNDTAVPLLGPLEAAGMEFDGLWVCGLCASEWPPAGRPSPFISRRLQREYRMPDADPVDTSDYARRVLTRLAASARQLVCSYSSSVDDAEQAPTTLLGSLVEVDGGGDVGWHANALIAHRDVEVADHDAVPEVSTDEVVAGGAATVQRQLGNPFAAFVTGRLGVRYLPAIQSGIAANLRGNLIHDVLRGLYADSPSSDELRSWSKEELDDRISAAMHPVFARHERHADAVLKRLYRLERRRVHDLLRGVVAIDRDRSDFKVAAVEGCVDAELQSVHFSLRFDRLDRLDDGSAVLLDYKTGTKKTFLARDGSPRDFQLVVYACTLPQDPAGLGLFNIDSREVSINGVGEAFDDGDDWHRRLAAWKAEVRGAIDEIRHGDVRVNAHHGIGDARPYALLSRFAELRREH